MLHCEAGTQLGFIPVGLGRSSGNGAHLQYVGVTPHARGGLGQTEYYIVATARLPHTRVEGWERDAALGRQD